MDFFLKGAEADNYNTNNNNKWLGNHWTVLPVRYHQDFPAFVCCIAEMLTTRTRLVEKIYRFERWFESCAGHTAQKLQTLIGTPPPEPTSSPSQPAHIAVTVAMM